MKTNRLTLGVPKGRIMKDAVSLFHNIGIDISIPCGYERSTVAPTSQSNLQLCPVRSKDVPMLLEVGAIDLAIVGSDTLLEAAKLSYGMIRNLDICRCRISLLSLKSTDLECSRMSSPKVFTKYPRVTREYFEKLGMTPQITKMNGSVEVALNLNLAPFVVDIVSTGATLLANNLQELDVITDVTAQALISPGVRGERRKICVSLLDQLQAAALAKDTLDDQLELAIPLWKGTSDEIGYCEQ